MKKLLSVILVLSMVLALGITAFADEYGQSTGVLEISKTYSFVFDVDTSKGVTVTDSNGILVFSDPVIAGGKVMFNVKVPVAAVNKVTKILVMSGDTSVKTPLAEAYVSIVMTQNSGNTTNTADYLEVGKTYPITLNVDTSKGVKVYDSNGILSFSSPIVGNGLVAFNIGVPPAAAGKATKIVVMTNQTAGTVLEEIYVTVAGTPYVEPPTTTPSTPSTPSTPTYKPNAGTGANSAAAIVALAVMAGAVVATKKIVK